MLIKGSFKQQNILWEVYFKSDLYPNINLEIGSSPDELFTDFSSDFQVYFSSDAVEVTTESPEDTFQPIIKHSATVNLLTKTYIGQYFWSESPLDIRVEIIRNKEIIFSGFVTQGSYSQSYSDIYDELNISCVDYLSVLEYYNYADISHNYDSYKTSANNVSFQKIFNNMLITGLDFTNNQKTSLYYDQSKDSILLQNKIFDDIEISELNFLGDDENSVDTKEDVLSKILTYLNLHIVQLGKDYLIFDWDYINNVSEGTVNYIDLWDNSQTFTKSLLTSPDYPELIKRFHYSSSSTNLTIADVYNKIQVNCSLDSNDDAIVSPFDDDTTVNIYPRKYLYQTEVLSPGNNLVAANNFLNYINLNQRTDLGDDFTVIDYYIQQISNPSWTFYGGNDIQKDFTVIHQDILKYVPYNSNGEAYKAYYVPSLFPERVGVTGLFSVGCIQKKQEEINKDMTKIQPSSLQMDPYIIISINGNGDDSSTGHYPTDQDLIDAVPIAEYNGNISGGVYSPTDEDTTNYIVFSGKIMYVPRNMARTTANWDKCKEGFAGVFLNYEKYTIEYFKDAGRTFRTNKFYTVDSPTSIQDDSKFDGSIRDFADNQTSPYLDLSFANSQDKNKLFEYNYTKLEKSDYSSIDQIKKLSVFECQLIIGDKTYVETVNSDGSLTYTWETYDSSLDNTVNQQSFTLGIDPNKGDYIIGQDYEIENTVTFDMNLGSNKGFAIPIKKSDNLSGNIKFKILGPFQLQWNDITRRHPTMFRHTKYTDNFKYILANCSSIVIKDFSCKLISDNNGLDVNNEKDLIYVSTEDKKYTNSYETDFDITSGLTSQEYYEKSINNKVYLNYPVSSTGEVVTKIVNKNYSVSDSEYLQEKPENFYIDQYFREYSKPRIIFQVPVREKLFTDKPMIDLFGSFVCFQTFKDRSFKLIGVDYSSDDETPKTLTFKELPEEFGKPADDFDWTDNSDTGGDTDGEDKGDPNESILVDKQTIENYFTITNTSSENSVSFTININSKSEDKHFYYTLTDKKWVKSKEDLVVDLQPKSKIRLRCIFQGNQDKQNFNFKPYLTFEESDQQKSLNSIINVSGNLQTLSAGDDYKNLENEATFANNLFSGKLWSFDGLSLPATKLTEFCYQNMFANCSNLKEVPDLPATTLKEYCYSYMFMNCQKLSEVPEIKWINTDTRSCEYMFFDCSNLTKISNSVFTDKISLANACYWGMFQNCTGITSVTISNRTLPTTDEGCFGKLFKGCSKLSEIVYYCDKLGEQSDVSNETYEWVSGVSSSGTWYNANNQDFSQMGDSLIPNGWVIENEVFVDVDPTTLDIPFTITNKSSSNQQIILCKSGYLSLERMTYFRYTDDDVKWHNVKFDGNTWKYTLKGGGKLRFISEVGKYYQVISARCFNFSDTTKKLKNINVSGYVDSLSVGLDAKKQLENGFHCHSLFANCTNWTFDGLILPTYYCHTTQFYKMFSGCTKLTTIPEDWVKWRRHAVYVATTEFLHCYMYMFENCTGLTKLPTQITVETVTTYDSFLCGMFSGCTGLTTIPENFIKILAYGGSAEGSSVWLNSQMFQAMFKDCTGLTSLPENLFSVDDHRYTLRSNNQTFFEMFSGCTGLTSLPEKLLHFCDSFSTYACKQMFQDCTGLTTIPEGFLNLNENCTEIFEGCFQSMFKDCTGLTTIPENLLSIFEDTDVYSFNKMFYGCTSLTNVCNIHFQDFKKSCCEQMFYGCTSLTTIPNTTFNIKDCTFGYSCCKQMFYGCTSLTTAYLVFDKEEKTYIDEYAFQYMFKNCQKLREICYGLSDEPRYYISEEWLNNVSEKGSFRLINNQNFNITTRSSNTVPAGWTIYTV